MKYKILLYADFGIDDTLALIFSFFSKDVEVVGIVADYLANLILRTGAFLQEGEVLFLLK
jgi:inosine-uridine nucleoside N-ribohydrolase